jgi:hypothetical protein
MKNQKAQRVSEEIIGESSLCKQSIETFNALTKFDRKSCRLEVDQNQEKSARSDPSTCLCLLSIALKSSGAQVRG